MKITTQGNGIKIGPRLEDKIASKMAKFDKYFGDEGTLNVRIRPEGAKMVIEITMKLDGKIYRAEARDEDILTGVDKTVDKLESQIRRQKTKSRPKAKQPKLSPLKKLRQRRLSQLKTLSLRRLRPKSPSPKPKKPKLSPQPAKRTSWKKLLAKTQSPQSPPTNSTSKT